MKSLLKQRLSLAKLRAIPWPDRWLLVQTFSLLVGYKCLLFIVPFHTFLPKPSPVRFAGRALSEDRIGRVVWAIRVVSQQLPLGFTCLVQALATRRLLGSHPNVQLCIGVQKSPERGFAAHAWVVYKNRTIVGEQAGQPFEPILQWH